MMVDPLPPATVILVVLTLVSYFYLYGVYGMIYAVFVSLTILAVFVFLNQKSSRKKQAL